MPSPTELGDNIYALSAQFRQRLAAREKQATTRLTRSYRRIYTDLQGRAMDLREAMEAKRLRGEPVSANSIRRLTRYKRLMKSADREMARYRAVVEDEVLVGQRDAALMGAREGPEMLQRTLAGIPEEPRAQIVATFGILPTEAIESLVGILQEESALVTKTIAALGEKAVQGFGDSLVLGIASGVGSRKIAADIRRELGVPLTDALTITRTALNKSHQMASLAGYRANPQIIKGWRWSADLGPRTCMCCIALHGQLFPLDEDFIDHWAGRCSPTPETISMAELGVDVPETRPKIGSGEDWFKEQPEAVQRAMMGPGKHDAWKAGQFEFGQLVRETKDPVWGRMYGEQTLKNLLPPPAIPLVEPPLPSPSELLRRGVQEEKWASERTLLTKKWIEENASTERTSFRKFGMVKPGLMRTVEFDGMLFHYRDTKGGLSAVSHTLEELASQEKLPERLTKETRAVYFSIQGNKDDKYWAKQYNTPSFRSVASAGHGEVVVYGGMGIDRGTFTHEMGHNLAQGLWETSHPPNSSAFGKAMKAAEPPTKYARNARSEDFAESVRLYFGTARERALLSRGRYYAIDRLMKEIGYGG